MESARSYFPVVLAIENSSRIRNLYVELDILATPDTVEVSESKPRVPGKGAAGSLIHWIEIANLDTWHEHLEDERYKTFDDVLAKFDANKLQRIDRGWRVSFEWEALQSQRIRLIKPVLYVYSPESAEISIKAKVFADSFPEPFVLEANVSIEVKKSFADLAALLPNWKELLQKTHDPDRRETRGRSEPISRKTDR